MKKMTSILLAITLLFSNIGFAINTHYCGGYAIGSSFSVGVSDLDCGMPAMEATCEMKTSNSEGIDAAPCCQNTHQILQLEDDVKVTSELQLPALKFLAVFNSLVLRVNPSVLVNKIAHFNFRPPLPKSNIQIRFQTFLI
jgi:hypothetical protein